MNFFDLPTLIFCSFLDNEEIIVIKCVSGKKSRGHRPFTVYNKLATVQSEKLYVIERSYQVFC